MSAGRGARDLKVRVRTARRRKASSTRWLERQLNDPYVRRARKEGMRGRAAYKLIEIDDKFGFLKPGAVVVDLGCAPGGWSQVAAERVNAAGRDPNRPQGRVCGVDLKETEAVPGAEFLMLDFLADEAAEGFRDAIGIKVDAVLSDMAAPSTGHAKTDHLRVIALCEAAATFAAAMLKPGGTFVAKVLAGGAEGELQKELKTRFKRVSHFKPPASRSDSSEKYVIATGFGMSGKRTPKPPRPRVRGAERGGG